MKRWGVGVSIAVLAWTANARLAIAQSTEPTNADTSSAAPSSGESIDASDAHEAPRVAPPPALAPAAPSPAAHVAARAPSRHQVLYRSTFAIRLNPLGVIEDFRIGYRYRLLTNPGRIYRESHVGLAATALVSPAFQRLGVAAEFAPLTVLQLSLQYEALLIPGAFNTAQSFGGTPQNATSAYYYDGGPVRSPPVFENASSAPYATIGHLVSINSLLQFRFGPIAVRDTARFQHNNVHLENGDRAYYDPYTDVLAPGTGWVITNDVDVLYYPEGDHFPAGLIAGVRYSLVGALYDNPVLARVSPDATAATRDSTLIQRVGPVLGYTFFDTPGARFNAPTVLLIVNWWAQHPYRTESWPAMPYMALAFVFRGDLL